MSSITLWLGLLTEKPIELGPNAFCINDHHCFTVWMHLYEQTILRRFCGKTVRISIEEVIPLRTDPPWRQHEGTPPQEYEETNE